MNFASPHWLWLLLLLVPLVALQIWSWRVRQRLLTAFVSPRLLETLMTGVSKQRQTIRLILFTVAVLALLVALARPRFGYSLEETKQSGLDIVVAIDTSKSMLADDMQPNRLGRAKLAAIDLMRIARTDRLGLVAFAGGAFLQCPLSLDEEAFRQSVEFLDVNVIPQGGTALAEAIHTARAAFKEATENHKILVLFTDGEDNDDAAAALAAAREAHKAGLRVFTIGVGTPNGEVLSTRDPFGNRVFIKDAAGNVVKSRLNESLLQQIAKETDGFYLPLTGARTMDVLYERGLAPLPKSEFSSRTVRQYHERFQWFIAAAVLLLLFEMLFPERQSSRKFKVQGSKSVATTALVLLCALNAFGSAGQAMKEYERGKFAKARDAWERLSRKATDEPRLRFNAGAAAFQAEDFDTALKHFNSSLSASDLKLQQQSYYNLGNTHFRLGEKAEEPKARTEQWEEAIRQYESALKLEPSDADAQFNLEVVKKKLEELKQQQEQQQQQQQQDKQDQQQKQDEQKKDQQQKAEQEKKEEQQGKQEQDSEKKDEQPQQQNEQQKQEQSQQGQEQKQQEQQAQDQRGQEPGQPGEAANYGRVMQMTPQQAQQLLDAQKSQERAMIFQPQILRTNRPPDRVLKDW